MGYVSSASEEQREGLVDFRTLIRQEARAPKPGPIDPDNAIRFRGYGERRYVLEKASAVPAERESPHADVLMKSAAFGDKGMIVDTDVSAEQNIVRQDDVISQEAVVTEVRAGHEETVVGNRGHTAIGASPVNRAILPDRVSVSDSDRAGNTGMEAGVLWITSDNCAVPNEIILPYDDTLSNHGVGLDRAVITNLREAINDCMRADGDIGAHLSTAMNERRSVNHGLSRVNAGGVFNQAVPRFKSLATAENGRKNKIGKAVRRTWFI